MFFTFANLGDKSPADGFDTEPTARALNMGRDGVKASPKPTATAAAPVQQSAPAKGGLDLDSLLG